MSNLISPAVTVKATPHPGGISVEFRARHRRVRPFTLVLPDRGRIDSVREALDDRMDKLKYAHAALPHGRPEKPEDFKVLSESLFRLGRTLLLELFGAKRDVLQNFWTFWRAAVPAWRNPTLPALVHCHGDVASMLPIELFPVFGGCGVANNLHGFAEVCNAFVGFSCVVSRSLLTIRTARAVPLHRDQDGRIPIRYFHHEGLGGAKRELDWFLSSAAMSATVEGPYPGSGTDEPTIAQQIFDPTLLISGGHRAIPDQIQHFSCHCYTRVGQPPRTFEIQLFGSGKEVKATIEDIGTELIKLADQSTRKLSNHVVEHPLVIMNACGSSALSARCAVSFPELFLDNGSRGFIGTEVAISDDIAAEFSRLFYEGFLLRHEPIGVAVLQARRRLLGQGNPLGLVYSVYGDARLALERQLK
jgi:hypothetical protein